MHYRSTVRTRVTKVFFEGLAPAPGAPVTAGEKSAGTMGSSAGGQGLALLRLDRVEEAEQAGLPLKCGEAVLRLA